MSQDKHTEAGANEQEKQEKLTIPDFTELWKEMYFQSEQAWAETFREYISSKTFVNMINTMLEQRLFNEKVSRQTLEKYFDASIVPTKHDVSRVAELVISLEEKIDTMEFQSMQAMQSMVGSLLKMVEHQESIKKELAALKKDNQALTKKLEEMNKKLAKQREPAAKQPKKASKTE